MRKAVIKDNKVINIIETDENGIQGLIMPEDQTLWDCTQYAVAIGDTFNDGRFYHESEPAEYVPSDTEKIAMVQAENAQLKEITNTILLDNLKREGAIL